MVWLLSLPDDTWLHLSSNDNVHRYADVLSYRQPRSHFLYGVVKGVARPPNVKKQNSVTDKTSYNWEYICMRASFENFRVFTLQNMQHSFNILLMCQLKVNCVGSFVSTNLQNVPTIIRKMIRGVIAYHPPTPFGGYTTAPAWAPLHTRDVVNRNWKIKWKATECAILIGWDVSCVWFADLAINHKF